MSIQVYTPNSHSHTWILQTATNQGQVFICVHAKNHQMAWQEADLILYPAGYSSAKRNGYFGYVTIGMLSYDANATTGIISESYAEELKRRHFARQGR